MKIETSDDIIQAKRCPYCMKKPEFVDSKIVYGKSYGMIYLCKKCDAWVGVHEGSKLSLGRLANKELRQAKKLAHKFFDPLWHKAIIQGRSKKQARDDAYTWLSKELKIPFAFCHIGYFDVSHCIKTTEICLKFYTKKEEKK